MADENEWPARRTPRQSGMEAQHEQWVLQVINFLGGLNIPFYNLDANGNKTGTEKSLPERLELLRVRLENAQRAASHWEKMMHEEVAHTRQLMSQLTLSEAHASDLELVVELARDKLRQLTPTESKGVENVIKLLSRHVSPQDTPADELGVERKTFDARKVLLQAGLDSLLHDFAPGQRLCSTCGGLSVVKCSSSYSLSQWKDFKGYPYVHEWVTPCAHCYMGKVDVCPHCDKDLSRSRTVCECKEAQAEKLGKELIAQEERWRTTPRMLLSDYKEDMLWAERADRYVQVDDIPDILEAHPDEIFFACAQMEDLARIEAVDVIEQMEQHAYDETGPDDDDAILDYAPDAEEKLQVLLDAWVKEHVKAPEVYMANMNLIVEVNRAE